MSVAPQAALYVHLRDDGGIFVVREDGSQGLTTRSELDAELIGLKARSGMLLYSRDDPQRDASPIVTAMFKHILDLEIPIRLLTEPHPTVSRQLSEGATSLMALAFVGDEIRMQDLLDRGATVEATDPSGYTALMYAAKAGNDGTVALLVSRGADPNAVDHQGSTPLMFAAQHGHLRAVRELITAGAGVDGRGDHGLTALGFALQNGHSSTATFLRLHGAEE
jgi:hypothetical protein